MAITIENTAKAVAKPLVIPYGYLVLAGLLSLVLWTIMSAIFAANAGFINAPITVIACFAILAVLMKPVLPVSAGFVGFFISLATLRDPRKLVPATAKLYVQGVFWLILFNALVGIFLTPTMATGETETAAGFSMLQWLSGVWMLILLAIAGLSMSIAFDIKSRGVKNWIVAGILALATVVTLWNMGGHLLWDKAAAASSDLTSESTTPVLASSSEDSFATSSCQNGATRTRSQMRLMVVLRVDGTLCFENPDDLPLISLHSVDPRFESALQAGKLFRWNSDSTDRFPSVSANPQGFKDARVPESGLRLFILQRHAPAADIVEGMQSNLTVDLSGLEA